MVCYLIIGREFIISGFRLVASDNGVVIAASYWGKFKTTFQMLMVIVLLTIWAECLIFWNRYLSGFLWHLPLFPYHIYLAEQECSVHAGLERRL